MAPEQALGRNELDGRLDLYAFGLILAECISGRLVVDCADPMSALFRHATPTEHELDAVVRQSPLFPVIATATRKAPDHRYPDALVMRQASPEPGQGDRREERFAF